MKVLINLPEEIKKTIDMVHQVLGYESRSGWISAACAAKIDKDKMIILNIKNIVEKWNPPDKTSFQRAKARIARKLKTKKPG